MVISFHKHATTKPNVEQLPCNNFLPSSAFEGPLALVETELFQKRSVGRLFCGLVFFILAVAEEDVASGLLASNIG